MSELSPEDIERRAAAKRYNEGLKLLAALLNAIAVATVGAAFLLPAVSGSLTSSAIFWLLLAVGLHSAGQAVLKWLRSED